MTKAARDLGSKVNEKDRVNMAISEEEQATLKLRTRQKILKD
jgi:hypothetical protein